MRKLWISFICLMTILSSSKTVYAQENIYVHDTKEVIKEDVEAEVLNVNEILATVGEARIYVVTLDTFDWNKSKQAEKLLESWGLDDDQIDHSLLLMLALEDEKYHCYVGSELKSEFSTSITNNLLVINLRTEFNEGSYSVGVRKTTDALYRKAYNIYVDNESTKPVFEIEDGLFYKGYPIDIKAEERRQESYKILVAIVASVPIIIYIMFKFHDFFADKYKEYKKKHKKNK